MQYTTNSEKETKVLAKKIVVCYGHHKPLVIALSGELGAGKTIFVQGFAKGLGIKDSIISPTFVLIRQYPISDRTLYHIDLYRVEDFQGLGLEEILENPNNIVLIEWAEKIKDLIPENAVWISLETLDEKTRKISIKNK